MLAWLMAARWRVLVVALALLVVLDIGRSIYGRVAYSQPTQSWDGAPYDVALALWPPARNVPTDASPGQKVYIENCAVCHGTKGDGLGVSAPSIYPRPRDFTQGLYKYKTTGPGQPPSDADLIRMVAEGLPASPMPYFSDILTEEEIRAVVDYTKSFSPTLFAGADPEAMVIPERVAPDAESLARGATLYTANCASCHGADGRARATLKDANGFTVYARDLTAPWTFRGGSEPEQVWLRLTNGLAPSPMPSFVEVLSESERWDVTNYVLSLARTAPWEPGGQLDNLGNHTDLSKRGEYLVHTSMCGLCHTQVSNQAGGIYRDEVYLAGGMQIKAYPYGVYVSRNLTSDPETGLGNRSIEEIVNILRNGQANDRWINFYAMPWVYFHNFTEEDATAIATYLKEDLPPVRSRTPPPMDYGFIETLVMKVALGLPVPTAETVTYASGNYSDPNPGLLPADWLRPILVGGQWLVLLGGVVAFTLAGPKEKRWPKGWLGWTLTIAGSLALLVVTFVVWVMYSLPALLPTEAVIQGSQPFSPPVSPEQFDTPEEFALAERGRYVFQTTPCASCHFVSGAGGTKVNGPDLGTYWSRNITSDPTTGVGAWTDAQIIRAFRSGISRDGRPLYWQGMPWDHFANMEEDDVRALVIYVRTLPPVQKEIPLPVPERPDDCTEFTFWFLPDNFAPGCTKIGEIKE